MQFPQLTLQENTKISMQGLKFIIVGFITMVIDFGVTWLLLPEFQLIVANSIGFLLANVTNFFSSASLGLSIRNSTTAICQNLCFRPGRQSGGAAFE